MNQSPAELRNAAARQLIARGRWRQALDVLNEAIRLDPRMPDSYVNRAEVFEQLGMTPQADADRRKFDALGGVRRIVQAESSKPAPARARVRRPSPAIGIRYPSPAKRRSRGSLTQTALTTFSILALVIAGGIGVYIAVGVLGDAIDGSNEASLPGSETPVASESPGPTDTPGKTIAPTPTIRPTPQSLAEALNGSPLSFSALQTAWQAKGIAAEATAVNSGVTGTATTPVSVTLSKGQAVMHLAVLFYGGPSTPYQDFDLADTVTPKEGRGIPDGAYGWYNRNVVVIVLDQDPAVKPDAFDAFANIVS